MFAPPGVTLSAVSKWFAKGWQQAGLFRTERQGSDIAVVLFRRPRGRQDNAFVYGAEGFCLRSRLQTDMLARCRFDDTHQARQAACGELRRLGATVPDSCVD